MHSSRTLPSRFGPAWQPLPRARRRALVVGVYVGFAAVMAAMYAGATAVPRWPVWLGVIAIALFLATALGFVRLVAAPGYAADTLDRQLDERQRMVRDHAYRLAYYALTLLFILLSLVVMYAAGNDASWQALREPALFLPWFTFLPGSLPSVVVAWTEPDPPEDVVA
jgi:hypothetical protein